MWDFAFLFYLIEKLDWALLEFAYKYGSFVFRCDTLSEVTLNTDSISEAEHSSDEYDKPEE